MATEENKIYGSKNRRELYENLSKDGFDLGTFEDFDRNMNDDNVRKSIHKAAINAGWDLPDFDQFDRDMAVRRMKIGGQSKEVDHATYDDFIKRHPSGSNMKPATPQPKPKPQQAPASVAPITAPSPVAPVYEAPDDPVLGTPWGTQGSATGQSKAYKPFAPGQVRETGDPGTPNYGIPYRPYTQMSAAARDELYRKNDYTVKQVQKMHDDIVNEQTRRNQPLVDTGIPEANNSVIKTQGQWEDELQQGANQISQSIVAPAVDKAITEFDKKADEIWGKYNEQSKYVDAASPMSIMIGRQANEAKDPEKILNFLQQQMEGLYKDSSFVEKVGQEADKMGIDRKEYIDKVIKPQIESDLAAKLTDTLVKRELPKSTTEYILNGLGNSIAGMLYNAITESKGQREIKNQAAAMTEEGQNPYYNPGTGAKLAQMGVSFAADAPFFGIYGRVSGQVAKQVAEREIQKLIGKGLSEGAARSIVGSALENSVGTRMKNYIMQHVISGSLTMGGYNLTSEGARQMRDSEFNPMRLAGSTAEGLGVGAAFGITGGASQALSQPLRGFSKIGAKVAGFGAEAETMYATEELSKMIQGEEGFTNPFEGSVEALEKLGVMKLSGGHLLKSAGEKLIRAKEVGAKQTAGETLAELLGPSKTGVNFTEDEQDYIRNSQEGKDLVESLANMHPDRAISEVNGKKKFTKEGEQWRDQLAENYDRFMNNPDIPAGVKQKVSQMLGGIYRPGLETGATITQNEDGSVILKTRDKDGNCVRDMKFDNLEDAEQWRDQFKSQMSRNDAVNMFNNASPEVQQNIVNIVKDEISGKTVLDEMKSKAGSMKQNRLKRQLEKINQTAEQYEGREMTEEEARNYIQTVIKDGDDAVFNEMYDLIRENTHPADELDTKRNYWEGQQLSTVERHKAQVDVQLAEERLRLQGDAFADEVIAAADYPDEKMAELAMRASKDDITGDQLKAALDYYNKTSKVRGMMDEAVKSVDSQVEAANAYVRRNTHTDSGTLIEGSYQGRNYYVTAGHFQVAPDGKLVPTDNSGLVILRDKETGEIVTASPNEILVNGIQDPNRIIEYNESMEGLRGQLLKEADDTIELHPDTPETPQEAGETFVGADGKTYMVNPIPDESGNIIWTKVEADLDDMGNVMNIKGEPQPLDIEEYRKAKSDEKDAAEIPPEEASAIVEGQQGVVKDDLTTEQAGTEIAQDQPTPKQEPTPLEQELERRLNGGQAENPQQATPRIPVDEKGRKIYEQATPEDALADLTAEFGEEDAQQMITQMVENTDKALKALQEQDTSNMTDMNDIRSHMEKIKDLQKKRDFWQSLIKNSTEADEQKIESGQSVDIQNPSGEADRDSKVGQGEIQAQGTEAKAGADTQQQNTEGPEANTGVPPVSDTNVSGGTPVIEQPAEPTAEQKVAQGTVNNNIGKRYEFKNQDGTMSEVVIESSNGNDLVVVTRQDFDAQGNLKGDPYKQDLNMVDVGNSIINGVLKPVQSTEEKLRQAFKGKVGVQNVIDVLSDEEQRQLLNAYERGDGEAVSSMINDLAENHREDIILNERNKRNDNVNRIMEGTASREEKLRRVRKEYQGFDDAVIALSDEAMQPTSLEEYIADLHSRQPKAGEGPLAYFSYDQDGRKVVGMQDETGYGTKSGGDANGFKPWLAPKGKGMSLQEYAETIHSQLPEAVKEQYSDQDVRNAILSVFGGAERPSDITTMMIKRGIIQAEQAARRMEEMWIDGPSYQKVADENTFAARLQRGKQNVNTEPTDAQKEAGNYKKGHISFGGYDFTIENPEGSMRRGTDKTGRKWEQKMNNTYGYILGKYGKDGDHLDMFINDAQDLDNWNGTVYVVDQVDPKTGKLDEHKILYGFGSLKEAKQAYLSNYEEGWQGLGKITGVTKEGFDQWLDSSKRKMKEFADHSIAKEHMVETEHQGFDSAMKQLNTRGISINDPDLMKEYGLTDLTLSKTGDHVTLNKIVVADKGQGNGTRFMEDLARLADEKGWTLALTPSGGLGAKSIKRLKDFYKRFGFADNKGRNTDFTTRESMIRRPKEYEAANTPEQQEQTLRDAVVEHLRSKGIDVSTDWKLGQKILDDYNGVGKLSASKKRAVETASLNPKEGSPADISTADGAKIQKKLESYANKLEKVSNLRKNFLDELAEELGATSDGSKSKYATFITKNGDKVTIRLGNHNATVSNFDYRGEDNGISIVVSRRENEGVKNDGNAHIVEAFYPEIALRKAYGKPLSEIVRSINEALNSGKYNDTTGLAEMEEVNADEIKQHKVYHGSGAEFDAFDHSHMGEGAGSQSFGYGTYVTTGPNVAEGYAHKPTYRIEKEKNQFIDASRAYGRALTALDDAKESGVAIDEATANAEKAKKEYEKAKRLYEEAKNGYLYDVEIPDENEAYYIDYQEKMGEQKDVLDMVDNALTADGWKRQEIDSRIKFTKGDKQIILTPNQSGADLYAELQDALGSDKAASEFLNNVGVTGIKYPAGTILGGGNGATNYVIFNENDAKITDRTKFFKTPDGHAYGYTYKGKIYMDPRIATSETPIHEYDHLWCEMKRQTAPEEWNEIKQVMLNDEVVKPIIDRVKRDYEELTKEGREDDFVEEVITQFSGKRGAERLREVAEEVAKEKGGIFGKAEAVTAMQRLKNILNQFWEGVAKMMGWKYRNANQIADRMMSDMLNGVDPTKIMKDAASSNLRSQAEIERTLMGVHNLTEDKLRKVLKQGGLANPSLAVIDTKNHMHNDYGDISLIPKASMIDSKTGRNAGTFTADAWTPTYPTVYRRMTDKGQSKFWKDIRKLNDEAGEVANHMRMAFDTWLDKEVGQERLAYWYMSERGMKPELVLNKNPYGEDIVKRIDELTDNGNLEVSRLPEEQIKEVADMYHAYKESIGEPVTPAEERIAKLKERIDPNKQTPFSKLQQFRLEELQKYGELLHNLNDFEYAVRRSAAMDGKPNVEATVDKAAKAVKEQNLEQDFDKWLQDKADSYGIEEWLYNGTDDRTGRQKYVRNTLENASKLMRKEGLNGAVGWSNLGNWIATVANKEKTLGGIRKYRNNLNTTLEQHDAWKENWSELLYPIVEKLGSGNVFNGDNIMADILEHKDFADYYKREYGKELSKEDRATIDEFIKQVRTNFPTGYFETKFERPVMLDEFEIAVVPENTSPDVVEALKNAGLDVRTYDNSGKMEERDEARRNATMDAVQGRDDIMFQMMGKKGAEEADKAEGSDERKRNLAIAEESEKAGVDAKAIKLATGWERGADGQWRYEIPDADVDILAKFNDKFAEMKADGVESPEPILKLGELLGEDNELFKYYPKMKNMQVLFSKGLPDGTSGAYDNGTVELNIKEVNRFDGDDLNNENVYGTLLHEIQHAIQDIEGFAQGGNLYTSTTDEGIKAIIEKKNREAWWLKQQLDANRKILNNPEELKAAAELENKSEKEVKDNLLETINSQAAEYDTINLQIAKIEHTKAPSKTDAMDLYHRLAGEVEARNVESRMALNDIGKRQTLASVTEDVPRDDQVIINGEGGESASIELSAIVDRKITKDEIDKAMNSNLVKRWLKGKGKDQAFNLFEIGSYLIKEMAKARLGINNKYEVDGMFNNTFEAIEHYMKVAREKGLETSIADKYDFHNSDRVKEIMDNGDPLYTDTELTEIGKHLKPEALNDLKEAIKSISENKQIQEEIERIKDYDNGDAVTKAFMLYGIATDRLREQYNGDERFYRKHTKIVSDDPTRNNIDISNEPNAELREGETTKSEYFLKGSVAKELAKRIATTPLTSNMLALPDDAIDSKENENNSLKFSRVGTPESEMTPEERQYWSQWDKAMKKWKEKNAIPETQTEAPEKPRFQQGESALDYAQKLVQWNRMKSLWQTAPKIEDYRKVREDKDVLEAARENEKRYPDSPSAKMRRAAAEFQRIRSAMNRQKAYDKATVKAVTDFAQEFMKLGFGDNLSRGEMERMLSSVKNATGAKDIKKNVDNIMNILIDNHLRNLDQRVQKLSSTKELSKTAQGVEKQGRLELKGQRMIQAFRDAREKRMTLDQISERMADVSEKMNRSDDEAPMWEQDYEGLSIARQYVENIEGSREEWADLDTLYKDAVKDYKTSGRSYKDQQEYLESLEQAMQENKIERIGYFGDIIGRLEGNIAESMQGAKEFVEREKQRIKHIQDIANYDLAGKDMGAMREKSKGKPANFFLQPLGTFEQMLKQFGRRNANGEGYLYDYFMRNWMDATDKAFVNEQKAKEELDAKAHEVFGDKVKRWSDLYDISRSLPTLDVEVLDGEEPKTFKLTQGNLLYIYMADKMNDGRMKLRKMGIDEEKVNQIKEFLDPRLVQLGDWLQDEYLPKKRTEYNKVHERMFGAPMAAIDNYFPLKVLGDARYQEQDVNVPDSETLPSTITGNIIKRRKNALPLDILHTDALSLAIEHVEDMERWAAQAEWNKDVNTLLSYTTFRNKVKNMNTIYGSGDALWNSFKDVAKMAAGTYNPSAKSGHADAAISNIAKGVTAAKINFRVYTAFKQILSAPAFIHDVNLADFVHDAANPYGSWKWAMENMPVFQKRWKSRQAGDTRLMDDPTDWKLWKNNIVQMATRMGMSPNALVDGVTCAVGARSIYKSRYKKYKEIGASDEVAHKRALQDAEIGYNLTQQSSEGAFVSAIQKDRTVAANMLSVFRNSSMAYTRQWVDAARNLRKRMQNGYKEDSIKFMTRQMQDNFGLDEAQAKRAAELEYAREGRRDVARLLNMMFGVTVAWNLGASLPYLLIGDDDNTKKEMLTDALLKGLIAGPTEGFAAGNIFSDFMSQATNESVRKAFKEEGLWGGSKQAFSNMGEQDINPLPLFADIDRMIGKMKTDSFAAAQEVFNIGIQSAIGVNPQTFTDIWNAAMDYGAPGWDGVNYYPDDKNLARPKELALFIMRLMNAPTSSWRNKYIDELGMNAKDAQKLPYEEMARRYAHYKHWKDAPIMGWFRGEEARNEKIGKIQKQFDEAVVERMERLTDQELMHNVARSGSAEEKRKYAKIIAQRLGVTPGNDSKKPKDEEWYYKAYQERMLYEDIREDEMLAEKYKNLENTFKEKHEEAVRKSVQDQNEFNKVNKEWKEHITEAKKEAGKRIDWIQGGKWSTPSGKKGNSKKAELLVPGKKQLNLDPDNKENDAIMQNIRKWRKEALEILMRAESDR